MTSICGKITSGIAINCVTPLQGGMFADLTLFNYDDVIGVTRNGSNPQIIEAIILASGAVGYVIEGKNNSLMSKTSLQVGKYQNMWSHEISGVAFDISPATKLQLEKAGNGKFIGVTRNNYKGTTGNSAFEIFGLDSGLFPSVIERDSSNADTQGAFIFTLNSKEPDFEPHLPASFFLTDYATTKALLDALI